MAPKIGWEGGSILHERSWRDGIVDGKLTLHNLVVEVSWEEYKDIVGKAVPSVNVHVSVYPEVGSFLSQLQL